MVGSQVGRQHRSCPTSAETQLAAVADGDDALLAGYPQTVTVGRHGPSADLPMTGAELALIAIICAAGAGVATTVGFGSALVTVPMLVAVDPSLVPYVPLVAFFFGNVHIAVGLRDAIDWRRVLRQMAGYLPAAVGVGWAAAQLAPSVRGTNAVALVLACLGLLAADVRLQPTGVRDVSGGLLAGAGGVVAGINGPPVLPLWWAQTHRVRRASLAAFFAVGDLVALGAMRSWPADAATVGAAGTAGAIVGVTAVRKAADRLEETTARCLTIVLLVVSLAAAVARLATAI